MNREILNRYAKLLVKSGLNVQENQEVVVYASIDQLPLVKEVVEEAYKAKAKKVIVEWTSEDIDKLNYTYRTIETLSTVEKWEIEKLQHRVDTIPCRLHIVSDDPDGLKDVDMNKISKSRANRYPILKPYLDKVKNKEQWCIAGAASKAWAKKVFPNLEEDEAIEKLWEAILSTSRVTENPIKEWEQHNKDLKARCKYLNDLHIKKMHYKSSNGTDFTVGLMDNSMFCGGSEAALESNIEFNPNIPSEECFTTPKRGEAEGIVYATMPLSYQGQLIEDFSIRFEKGKAVEVHAKKGEDLLKQMIAMDEDAPYLGECALIPYNSPIKNTGILFYETLYDENASCHLALGMGYIDCVKDFEKYTLDELKDMGVNDSMIHVDFMIGAKDMDIEGITQDGKVVQIFKDGNWAF